MIDQLLKEIGEDKTQNMTTTSLKFKRDVWEFFQGFEDGTVVEFGTHKGQTTKILSHLFKKVYTVNNQDNAEAKKLNEDIQNIEYISNFNLYSAKNLPIYDIIDVFLIDAGHNYGDVIWDIHRAISLNRSKECYIIFDDYGLQSHTKTVKKAVDDNIHHQLFTLVKGIGHNKGHHFGDLNNPLNDYEGVIVKFNQHQYVNKVNE
jgi:hypothetical protein